MGMSLDLRLEPNEEHGVVYKIFNPEHQRGEKLCHYKDEPIHMNEVFETICQHPLLQKTISAFKMISDT